MPDNNSLKVCPISPSDYSMKNDAIYVHNPYRSFVGVGNTPLDLSKLQPEFRGFIIFVNGYIPDKWGNAGSTLWNSIRDKSPERNEGYNGGRNVNMEDWEDSKDRYKEKSNKEEDLTYNPKEKDETLKGSDYYDENSMHAWGNVFSSKDNKQHRLWEYWNQKDNYFRFSLEYSQYFRSRGNVFYINGSHGLESSTNYRMESGYKQGYAWAKENFYLLPKKEYDKYIELCPWLATPEYMPVTLVLHSQGNAKGIGVAKGIMEYVKKDLGWDKMALNLVMLSVHQNYKLTGGEYTAFKQQKEDLLADRWVLSYLPSLYSKDKLKKETGIDEYAEGFVKPSSWAELKKHAVQFTFANDRGDIIMRMGDIKGIVNACHDDNTELFPFTIDDWGNFTLNKGRILENHEGPSTDATVTYTQLVKKYTTAYHEYRRKKKYFEKYPRERYMTTTRVYTIYGGYSTITIDLLENYRMSVIWAYGDLFNAEVNAHGAPISWGLDDGGKIVDKDDKHIFKLIQQKGDPIFYKSIFHSNLLISL